MGGGVELTAPRTGRPGRRPRGRGGVRAALGVVALGCACAAGPAAVAGTAAAPVAPIRYQERTLANGLRVISVPSDVSPTVSVQVWYHVGSKDDPEHRSGFAHLFEHLMFKGSAHLASEQFDRLTEDVGGSNNAFTSDDTTAYVSVVPSNHLEVLLWAEAERMSNLDVNQANFVSERAVVEEEYRQRVLAPPYGRFGNAIPALAYQVHPYRRPTIGSIDDLEAATLADVVAFHQTHYRPDNATLVVAGDFEPGQLQAWVDRYFAPLPRPRTPLPRVSELEPAWTHDRDVQLTTPRLELPAVAVVWLAAALLGTGESSRLNQALVYRERVASDVSFEFERRVGPGLLVASAIAASGVTTAQLQRSLLAQVRRLARAPIPQAELAKVQTQLLTSALLSRQTPEGLGSAVAEAAVVLGDPAQVNSELAALQRVNADQVRHAVQRYLLDAHRVSVAYTQAPAPAGSAPVAPAPAGSAPEGPAPAGAAPGGPTPGGPTPARSAPAGSAPTGSAP